ncbi:relaxase/mobilization nuclease domain-containing protein [Persicitalea jodogahamensis]|uniref:MobA/VirD2-like nuclease domain-containing protein n=1 Tax=Persicitalea jodogahamensis TaxID=402147 RepID=A0A8J3GC32_9BACT|nr:relaxase/mobilization nuclease domain-containing protein [Persicitalea jodogahamensis]GHB86137.1 hypothetical protein GCM10007390_46980 [Persicitalea jodogahamensis]
MIGKIGKSGQNFLGVLSYCKYERAAVKEPDALNVRGELIYHQHINALLFGDKVPLSVIAGELSRAAALNSRTKKPVSHVSLSFPPGESPNKVTLRSIVIDFAKSFGFEGNGLIAFKHSDKEHEHIHIIANKVDSRGKNTARSSYDYLEIGRFCRKMEVKYDLIRVKQMDVIERKDAFAPKSTAYHEKLRRNIDDLLPECNNLHGLQIKLLKFGFKSKVGSGIGFICAKTGTIIKGSSLGRQYSKNSLIQRINGTSRGKESPNPKKKTDDKTEAEGQKSELRFHQKVR